MVWFDGLGWCWFSKRLERGSFELPQVPADVGRVVVDAATRASLLEGNEPAASRRLWYRRPTAVPPAELEAMHYERHRSSAMEVGLNQTSLRKIRGGSRPTRLTRETFPSPANQAE
jgi:hypothetical protein